MSFPFSLTSGLSGYGNGGYGGDTTTPLLYPSTGNFIRSGANGTNGIIRMYCYNE